jgi:hypothetical protein
MHLAGIYSGIRNSGRIFRVPGAEGLVLFSDEKLDRIAEAMRHPKAVFAAVRLPFPQTVRV